MATERQISRRRQEAARLRAEVSALAEALLERRRMIAGSLLARRLGTREKKRSSVAYYLTCAEGKRRRFVYVPKAQVREIRERVEAWRRQRRALRRLRAAAGRLVIPGFTTGAAGAPAGAWTGATRRVLRAERERTGGM
jgi:hypothetical protein